MLIVKLGIIMFLQLSQIEQFSIIDGLHIIRNTLTSKSLHTKKATSKKRTKKPMKFDSPELEELFNSMSPECKALFKR